MHLAYVSISAKYNFTLLKTKNVMVQALDSLPIGVGGGLPRAKSPSKTMNMIHLVWSALGHNYSY